MSDDHGDWRCMVIVLVVLLILLGTLSLPTQGDKQMLCQSLGAWQSRLSSRSRRTSTAFMDLGRPLYTPFALAGLDALPLALTFEVVRTRRTHISRNALPAAEPVSTGWSVGFR
jgi:hypothetical protein